MTAYFPTMSRQVGERDWGGYAQAIERGFRAMAYFLLPAAAALTALAPVLARSVLFGQTGAVRRGPGGRRAGRARAGGVRLRERPVPQPDPLRAGRHPDARTGQHRHRHRWLAADGRRLHGDGRDAARAGAGRRPLGGLHRRCRRAAPPRHQSDPGRPAAPDGTGHRPVAGRRGGGRRGDVGRRRADRPAGEGRLDRRDARGRGGRARALCRAGRRCSAVLGRRRSWHCCGVAMGDRASHGRPWLRRALAGLAVALLLGAIDDDDDDDRRAGGRVRRPAIRVDRGARPRADPLVAPAHLGGRGRRPAAEPAAPARPVGGGLGGDALDRWPYVARRGLPDDRDRQPRRGRRPGRCAAPSRPTSRTGR